VVVQYNKQRILQLENVRLQSVLDESSEYIVNTLIESQLDIITLVTHLLVTA